MNVLTKDCFDRAWDLVKDMPPSPLNYKIISSKYIGEQKTRARERTWKERLFTLPWKPRKKLAFYTIWVSKQEVILDSINGIMYVHPSDYEGIREQLNESKYL